MYQLADYFGTVGLDAYALKRFKAKAEKLWMSEGFLHCIRDVYDSTVHARCKMRATVVEITRKHLNELWKTPLKDLVRAGGDFAVDLMDQMVPNDGASF